MGNEFIDIDKNQLDVECERQPELVYQYGCKLADAKKELAEANADLDVIKAEVADDVRSNPKKYGLDKITVDAVASAVAAAKEVKAATTDVIAARHLVDTTQAAVNALDHKKRMLENLVDLHGRDYFSSPRVSGDGAAAMEQTKTKRIRRGTSRRDEDED
jgi:kynurenine formamidase